MDYQKKLKEWYEHYEARYKKAVSLHIDEGSRHYQAFKEIEKRYSALYITLHFYREIPRILAGEEAEKLIKSYIIVILKTLFFGEVIKNEDGKTECIHPWLKINKSDAEKVEAYEDAILARKHFSLFAMTWTLRMPFRIWKKLTEVLIFWSSLTPQSAMESSLIKSSMSHTNRVMC